MNGKFLLKEKYLVLLLGGMFAGVYYFLPERSVVNFQQILSSMNLMQDVFLIFLTEYRTFLVEKSTLDDDSEATPTAGPDCKFAAAHIDPRTT